MEEKKFWQSTNFITYATILVLGLFIGFPEGAPGTITQIILGIASLRNLISDGKFDVIGWVKDANFWGYLASIAAIALPGILDPKMFEYLSDIVLGLINGESLQSILVSAFALLTIILKKFGALKEGTAKLISPTVK